MEFFFNPKSVAIVGASRNPIKFGSIILANLFALGYEGKIFPINPKGKNIAGLKTYPSVRDVPDEVDLAIFAIPAPATVEAMRDCAEKRVKGVVIISSGFNESGEVGARFQRELLEIARGAGIRIIGPNTTGILNPYDNFTTTFVLLREVRKGPVAFIAQTGMFAGMLMEWVLSSECFGISRVVGLGNKCDVDDADVLRYLAEDDATKVIMMYIESVKDGSRFMEAARATTIRKPIIALKSGRTGEGAAAAMSHTGSLAGNDDVVSGAFKQVGIVRVDAFQKLTDHAKMFAYQPVARGNRLAIVSLSGGAAVMSADAAIRAGFRLAHFPDESIAGIQKHYPSWAKVRHPFDIEPLTETIGYEPAFDMTIRCALGNPETDACIVVMWAPFPEAGISYDFLKNLQADYPDKPMAFCCIGYKEYYEALFRQLESYQIPVYTSFTRAVDSLAASAKYGQYLKSIGAEMPCRSTKISIPPLSETIEACSPLSRTTKTSPTLLAKGRYFSPLSQSTEASSTPSQRNEPSSPPSQRTEASSPLSQRGARGDLPDKSTSLPARDKEPRSSIPDEDKSAETPKKLTIFIDGASHGNPGPAAVGIVIKSSGKTIREIGETIGKATNNYAEYSALIRALEEACKLGASEVDCFSDSELLVRQMTGVYSVKSRNLLPLVSKAQTLRRTFKKFSLHHVDRSKNERADDLAGKALKK
ncbi:CoA-binding protein [Candidatus Poribacteria bacterium]|nr:CoA-binding protein [Candidatus Poribacteria bacterium]